MVRPLANVVTTSRDRISMPTITGGNSRYTGAVRVTWVDEQPTGTEAATNATFGQLAIEVLTSMAHTQLSKNLVEDSAFDLPSYLSKQFALAMAIDEDEQFLTGPGGSGKPQGILSGTAANGAPFDANVTVVNSGIAASLSADGLISLPYGIAAQYRQTGAVFVMNKATSKSIRLLKNGQGDYMFVDQSNTTAVGILKEVAGFPIKESEAMPDIAANKYPIIFGDLGGYAIADRIGLSIERYDDSTTAKTNSIVYVARRRLGGMVTEGWRIAVQKVSA